MSSAMLISWSLANLLLFGLITQNFAKPLFILRRLGSSSTSFNDNPAIRPLNLMDSQEKDTKVKLEILFQHTQLLRLITRNLPDLPESYSTSASQLLFVGNDDEVRSRRLSPIF
ncbi:hypothetical protein DICVIV_01869 [Dictyocaulus viviparus]|uniref:Uncharacterized protein n=1 Tax=Dictyocaulus viviparus TaxID=29172 RepID=A0A0D8Y532_DICVI|nr:hypothetical protein DICVIV_01869 [Dictyocaulus viviparus]